MQSPHYTKKDFTFIAGIIAQMNADFPGDARLALVARRFARALRKTNPAFDTDTFLAACGVTPQ